MGSANVANPAEETGEEVFEVEEEGSPLLAFKARIERLKTRYTLGYYSTNKKRTQTCGGSNSPTSRASAKRTTTAS